MMNSINSNKISIFLCWFKRFDCYTVGKSPVISLIEIRDVLTGNPEHEIIYFRWKDNEGQEFNVTFTEQNVSNAKVNSNGNITMDDSKGNSIEICTFSLTKYNFTNVKWINFE